MVITSQCGGAGRGPNCDRLQCLQTAAGSSEASGGFVCHLCSSSITLECVHVPLCVRDRVQQESVSFPLTHGMNTL